MLSRAKDFEIGDTVIIKNPRPDSDYKSEWEERSEGQKAVVTHKNRYDYIAKLLTGDWAGRTFFFSDEWFIRAIEEYFV